MIGVTLEIVGCRDVAYSIHSGGLAYYGKPELVGGAMSEGDIDEIIHYGGYADVIIGGMKKRVLFDAEEPVQHSIENGINVFKNCVFVVNSESE